jgi:hypothetical protein
MESVTQVDTVIEDSIQTSRNVEQLGLLRNCKFQLSLRRGTVFMDGDPNFAFYCFSFAIVGTSTGGKTLAMKNGRAMEDVFAIESTHDH